MPARVFSRGLSPIESCWFGFPFCMSVTFVDRDINKEHIGVIGVNMSVKDDVIRAMKEAGKPMSAGEVEKATGIDRKEIDKAFKELKAEGAIVSPVRCKWEPAQ